MVQDSSTTHLFDNLDARLAEWAERNGLPAYRRKQVRHFLFEQRAADWDAMTVLPKTLRAQLAEELPLWAAEISKHSVSKDGAEKLLLNLERGGVIECVLLRDTVRRTVCISTQVGCAMGCVFCASGLDGVERNLSTGEIVEQTLQLQRLLGAEERLSHLVVMGMGEPLANLDNLLPALGEVSRDDGLGISPRRITISTVGLPPAIRRLASENPRYRLAISLHAPNDELRNQIVPVNRNIGVDEIMSAADDYYAISKRRLTFEYVLLSGINDQPEHAHQLVRLLRDRHALLNVIPYNPVAGLPYATPTTAAQHAFRGVLEAGDIPIRFRHRKGDDINAACGQLRRSTPPVTQIDTPT
ncbi:putative dual-specificity RNA methyltransferase RlmN [Pseudobythopirellula maris]|uniref:Probable dual-specificity RNA methyltransferase RlmN n=1 Tax=Pseudobythopirellula maris TaxID=2527991 RepID=A0A5C5ZVD4_9BACT|nr:23S rRNA (adenine(2503)-C(2))-methyltransferase RlmN [Pseudobythopirellula maris]TWT91136.1 putative dual-specificity RNA methyltransferase RlmN [Pseudobythopirellula maris]